MKIFNFFLKYLFILPIFFMWGCASEDLHIGVVEDEVELSQVPIEFIFGAPEDCFTRGIDNEKRYFSEKDMIHVEATFFNEDGTFLSRSYKAYEMDLQGKWKPSGNSLNWPTKAKKGKFKAYFINNIREVLLPNDIRRTVKLSDVEDQTDPLYAETEFVSWGHRVNLQFTHLCTHLTFTGLDPDISDYFWLINKNENVEFNNVFSLKVSKENELISEWFSEGDEGYNDLVYIQHGSKNLFNKDDNVKYGSEVSFFLKPGDYSNVELRTINNYSYFTYQSNLTSELKANIPYVVNIKTNKGVTFIEDDDEWDDEDYEVKIMNPNEFLHHIVSGEEYEILDETIQEKKKVLQKTSSGIQLRYNVSFQNNKNFEKLNIPTGLTFDGGNHYISDVTTNIFGTNHGTIQHLGLKDINCSEELWYRNTDLTYNHWGVLCEVNEGLINNIKIDNANLNFKIGEGRDQAGYVYNIGMLVGVNRSNILKISYGNITILSANHETESVESTVNIGGLIGQNVKEFKRVDPLSENTTINMTFSLKGNTTTLYIGGAVGQSSGNLQNISIPSLELNASQCLGLRGNVGGLIGRLRGKASISEMSSCTVKGTVKGFPVNYYNNLLASSYTGGMVGYEYNFNVKNCRSACSVTVPDNISLQGNITYATGGGFGRIINPENIISDNYILGDSLSGPVGTSEGEAAYIGNFAGIVPSSIDWLIYLNNGNSAKEWLTDQFIGAQINDAPPTDDD